MSKRRNDLEIRNEIPQIALQTPNSGRSPLYDVRYHAPRCPSGQRVRIDVSRTTISRLATARRSSIPSGGARRDRTDDLMLAKHALSQLSYGPVPEDECLSRSQPRSSLRSRKACRAEAAEQRRLVGLGRLELPTSRLSSARSNQLSYKPLTTRSIAARTGSTPDASHERKPLARVRPRRKRNEDGEIPPMELTDLAIDGP
jgi:hypothetical protein